MAPFQMNNSMVRDFIDQTGRSGDAAEYADPSRSQVDTMFYTGVDPWHRMGTRLDNPATAAEAIAAAGLDWAVSMEPALVQRNGSLIDTGRKAITREDTGDIFAVGMTDRYTPLQNKDAFQFFDAVVGAGEAIYHTAGSLRGGRIIWILAKMPGDIGLTGDPADKYIMLSNSHDGTMGVDMRFCVRRIVCMNTFKMALASDERNTRYRHTTNLMQKVNQTRNFLGLADAYFANFMAGAERLASKSMDATNASDYFADVLNYSPTPEHQQPKIRNTIGELQDLWYGDGRGADLASASGTAWGAFNAVSEWLEHHRYATPGTDVWTDNALLTDRRLTSSFYGNGAKLEQRAWDKAMALVG